MVTMKGQGDRGGRGRRGGRKEEGEGEGGGEDGGRDIPKNNYSRSHRTSQYLRRQW
jgi:hypothetical protein